jgi:hypothetical protein
MNAFIKNSGTLLANLKPDANGTFTLNLDDESMKDVLGNLNHLLIVVSDKEN